jgi:putative ABC transport system permease protein
MFLISVLIIVLFLACLLVPLLYWDKGRRSLVLALRSLWLHKLRAFLSVLGIIIGTGAVIALMAFGEGSMQDALDDIARMGATNIIVRSVKPPDDGSAQRRSFVATYGLTQRDYDRFATLMDSGTVTRMVPMRIFPQDIRHLEKKHQGRTVATTPEYAAVSQIALASGRFLVADDDLYAKNVAVLGASVADDLYPFADPVGQTVQLNQFFFVIVGVMKDRIPTGGGAGQVAEDFNHDVYIPLNTCRGRFGEKITYRQSGSFIREQVELSQVTLTVSQIDKVRPTGEVIKNLLDDNHLKSDWAVTVPLDRLEQAERAKDRYTMLLALIASISLAVGGIGIMNIMLATVTERTREIGIRRALGAKRRDITLQFLIEAMVQTTTGGLVGIVAGLAVVFVTPRLLAAIWESNLPAKVHVPSIFISLIVSVAVGIGFGLYPALRAARLDPIEALRHD